MPAIRRRWTTADVRALMDESRAWPRYELIGGELVVTPAPAQSHQLIALEIALGLHDYLAREPVGVVVMSPADVELQPGTITQPDVFVIPASLPSEGEAHGWGVTTLLLAVEVLSPSSARMDRVEKRDFYLDAGVPEYWIVDADARMVERWTPARETPEVLRGRLMWAPPGASTPLALELPGIFDAVARKLALIGR